VSNTAAAQARLIGAIFLEWGLVLEHELAEALQRQETTGGRLGEILVAYHGISRMALASALAEQWSQESPLGGTPVRALEAGDGPAARRRAELRRPIGEVLVELGIVGAAELEKALDVQRLSGERLGEILVRQGSLSRLDLAGALSEHWASVTDAEATTGAGGAAADRPTKGAAGTGVLAAALDALRRDLGALTARIEAVEHRDTAASLARRLDALEELVRDLGVSGDVEAALTQTSAPR